ASGHSDPEKSFSLNVNIVAGFLLLVYPLNFGFAERGKKTKVFLIAAFVMFAAIMATKSRSAIALAYIVTIFYFVRLKKDAALKIFAAAATAIFLAGLIYAVRSKIGWASLSDRLMWWKTCLIMFKANHFFGVGFGNFSALYLFYRPELTLNTIFAHNIVLQLLAETGIFGFAAFAAAASSIAKNIFSRIKSGPYIMAAFVSTAAFICLNLTDYSFFIPANMLVFYVIVGTAFTAVISKRKKLFPALAVFIPALYLIYVFAASVNAQSYYEEGNFLFNEGKYEQAAQKYEKATQNDEINPVYRHSLSESMYSLCAAEPDSEKRKLYLQTAVDSDLKAEQYYRSSAEIKAELAFLYKFSGDDAKAAEYMELARKCDKFNPRLRAGEKKNE
ncbi:MAG: O-antigen ligase family protein, partial [Endomicrobia bacterium]|nr:O-antigen ligase family protein [Endomicrobiia bacterium]